MTSNGRAINVLRTSSRSQSRSSPYSGNGKGREKVTHLAAVSRLSDDKITRCLQTVELALRRCNHEEALAAIDRAFLKDAKHEITIDSHLEELELRDAIIDTLNIHHISTIRELTLMETPAIYALAGLKEADADTVVLSVETLGFRFSTPDDDA